jgi:putative endonuclease
VVVFLTLVVVLDLERQPLQLDLGLRLGECRDVREGFCLGFCYHAGSYGSSFRDGPKDQTSGTQLRAGEVRGYERSGDMSYYVYILASRKDGATYVGVTNDIVRRIYEHRIKAVRGYSSRYNITRLVWFEIYDDPISAISREKELKKWRRAWKVQLIEAKNPRWDDLYESICR